MMLVRSAVEHVQDSAPLSGVRRQTSAEMDSDEVWRALRATMAEWICGRSRIAPWLSEGFSEATDLVDLVCFRLAGCYSDGVLPPAKLIPLFRDAFAGTAELVDCVCADLSAILARDPAVHDVLTPLLFFKGFLSITCQRCAHHFWNSGDRPLSLYLQHRIAAVSGIDIHPAARIGRRVLMDHGTGVVIGETAVLADDVTLFHNVTLGGTGKERGDRHPKVNRGAFLGAGATLLGNIVIGEGARIAAGSLVMRDVPAWCVAAGTLAVIKPARINEERPCFIEESGQASTA